MSLNIADPLARLMLRLLLGTATRMGADPSNHLAIPGDLKDYANLRDDILLIGQGDYFEIWAPELWDKQQTQINDAETNSSRFTMLTVAIADATFPCRLRDASGTQISPHQKFFGLGLQNEKKSAFLL